MGRRTLLLIRLGVFAGACVLLYVRLTRDQGNPAVAHWRQAMEGAGGLAMVGVLVLMGVNWGLEAWKWRLLMRPVQRIGALRAFTATLAGTSVGLLTPNRVGEFAGRVLFLAPEHRVEGGLATLLGSIAQFVVTLLMGTAALLFDPWSLAGDVVTPYARQVIVGSAVLLSAASLFLFFSPGVLGRVITSLPWLRRFERHARVLSAYGPRRSLPVFLLSIVRYAVFTAQFAWLLNTMAAVPWTSGLVVVPVVYLITTLTPTTVITELGVRGSATAALLPGEAGGVVLASAMIWVINLALPALIGGLVLLFARIRSGQDP